MRVATVAGTLLRTTGEGMRLLARSPALLATVMVLGTVVYFSLPGIGVYNVPARGLLAVCGGFFYFLLLWLTLADEDEESARSFRRAFALYHLPFFLFVPTFLALRAPSENAEYLATLWPFAFVAVWLACTGAVVYAVRPAVLHRYFLVVIIGWALYLRLLGLLTEGLWYDELFTLWLSRPDLSFMQIIHWTTSDFHPPLHYIGMWIWFKMVGVTPFTARIVSVAGGILGILAMYGLGKRAGGKWTGVLAAFLTCVTYIHVYYSQEVRSYIFLFAATAWCYSRFLRLLEAPGRRAGLLYGAAAAVTIYLHYYGFLVLLAQGLFLVLAPGRLLDKRGALLRWYTLGIGLAAVLFLPWGGVTISKMKTTSYWIWTPDRDFYLEFFVWYFRDTLLAGLYALLIVGVLFHFLYRRRGEEDPPVGAPAVAVLCLLGVLTAWFLPYLHSMNATPMLFDRYTLVCVPPILLLIALAITQVQIPQARIVLVGFIFYGSMMTLFVHENYYEKVDRMQVRELVSDLLEDRQAIIASDTVMTREFTYYFETLGPHPMPVCFSDNEFEAALLAHATDPTLRVWLYHCLESVPYNKEMKQILKVFFFSSRNITHYGTTAVLYEFNEKIPRDLLAEYIKGDARTRAEVVQKTRGINNSIDWSKIGVSPASPRPAEGPTRPSPTRRPVATGEAPSSQ